MSQDKISIYPNLSLSLNFNGNAEFSVNWVVKGEKAGGTLNVSFTHKGQEYVADYEDIDCEAFLDKNGDENIKTSKFTITGIKVRPSAFSSGALKYTVPNVISKKDQIYEYSIPTNGLPFAKQENKLESFIVDLPHQWFRTASLIAAYPPPDKIVEINEKNRLIYDKDTLEKADQSFHLKFRKLCRMTTCYLMTVGIISGVISALAIWGLRSIFNSS